MRDKFILSIATLVAAITLVPSAVRASEDSQAVVVPRLGSPPATHGVVDPSWDASAVVKLGWDFQYHHASEESTTVYVAQCGQAIYVAFKAIQREPVTSSQHTNGPGVYLDDNVNVDLWPQGTQGFHYQFTSTPDGTYWQTSSENSAYAPEWQAAGRKALGGYTVTMRIPLNVVRYGGSTTWRAQFSRTIVVTSSLEEWTFGSDQRSTGDVVYSGLLKGIDLGIASKRPPARFQPYVLDEAASRTNGGSTSRIGADFSFPVTPTASIFGTVHPDYSNVEIDQQSIAPQEFARYNQEVRPFFTQLASNFNNRLGCVGCPTTFYSPSVPTFREGFAVEGTQGPFNFAAFDANASLRTDDAKVLGYLYQSTEHIIQFNVQQVEVALPSFADSTTTVASGYGFSHNHAFIFANGGQDRGTFVTDSAQASYSEYGFGLANSTSTAALDYMHIGPQFTPVDGYSPHPSDITGPAALLRKEFTYKPTSFIQAVSVSANYALYRDQAGSLNESDQSVSASVQMRDLVGVGISTGSSYLLTPNGIFAPFNQNGATITYGNGTSAASGVTFQQGGYYHGALDSWFRFATVPIARHLLLTIEDDNTAYVPDSKYSVGPGVHEIGARELLERTSLDWQLTSRASFDVGFRRISGQFAPTGYGFVPTTASTPISATNLSAAFHFLAMRNEFYLVYGDPSQLGTAHALVLKWIRYVGADKGS